ncbi:flagellar hook-associated protein FlgK [Sphingobium phenoxybenzoativorans]|uniref:Flagellar hook-associated protein 1 n=1 Tax=Sphingobium phenoxybenzoativorans TaxID=1592790 RepID=A0A975Q1W4_9SPHN|nr:flagellar hook-associated protein FlgK [Sphingobium phenoxybenzoativorans]QUT05847.1 flagellar hook-associated protein FlgK [Sphingobium phenoxybenzoativorans]
MSSDLFQIGASGTRAYRAAMGAISENIANASTAGYSRRTVTTRESALSSSSMVLYKSQVAFGGVEVQSVNRANDPYLDAAARMTGQALASANQRLQFQTDIETALNDDTLGVGQQLSGMYGAVTQLAANPTDPSLRTNVLFGIEQVVTAFNQSAHDLEGVQTAITSNAQAAVSGLNSALEELGRINANLLRSQPGTANQAQLLDSRDQALSQITSKLDVNIAFGASGTAQISYNGTQVVQGKDVTTFDVTAATDGTLSLSLGGAATTAPASGSLGGLFQSATVASQRLASLDALAAQFTTDINTWHSQGLTNANAAGGPLVSGTTAADLTKVITNIADLATKSSDGTLNGNLNNISSIRGTGGVEAGWTALVAANANLLAGTKAEQTAAETRDTQARQARENVSGVDLDMEAADLLRIQQAYSGCAKIIQVARETFDAIMQIL